MSATQARRSAAPGLVLVQIVSLQLGSAVAKGLFAEVGATATAAMRIVLAAVVMCVVVRPRVRGLGRDRWTAVLALGAVLALMNLAYFSAIALLPLGVAATVELLGPIALALALTRRLLDVLWGLLAVAGLALLAWPDGPLPGAGIAVGLLAAAGRAAYVLLNRRVGALFDDWSGLALALAVGACVMAPIGVVAAGDRLLDGSVLATGLAVAVLSSLLPYSLDLLVLRRISARAFGILLGLGPAVGALVGLVLLGEVLTGWQVVAVAMVAVAAAGAVHGERRARTPPGNDPDAGPRPTRTRPP